MRLGCRKRPSRRCMRIPRVPVVLSRRDPASHLNLSMVKGMAKPKVRVVLANSLSRQYTGGRTEFEIEAARVRDILKVLERMFPGIREHLEEETAVSIDGMIYDDAFLQEVTESAEVFFIPKLDAG